METLLGCKSLETFTLYTLPFPWLHFVQFCSCLSVAVCLIEVFYFFCACPNMVSLLNVKWRLGISLLSLQHTNMYTHTGGYTGTAIGSSAYLLCVCLEATYRAAPFRRKWAAWFPWLSPINTFLSVVLEASNKSCVFDRVDKKATCPGESRRGSVTLW